MAKKEKLEIKIASIEDSINTKYKSNVAMTAVDLEEQDYKFIPTSLGMDIALNGGFLEGTIMNLGGIPKAGKTTLCLEIMKNAMAMGKEVYYVDVEARLQPSLINCIAGLDKSKLHIIKSTDEKFLTAEDFLQIIMDLFKSKSGILVVLDSLAALCPESAFSTEMAEGSRMAAIPTLMYKFLRLSSIIQAKKSNLITITHLQSNPGGYGSPLREVGGNAIQFFGSYLLRCQSAGEVPKDGDERKTGKESIFKVAAVATGKPASKFTFYIRYGNGYDRAKDIATLAEEIGLVTKAGAWYKFTPEGKDEVSCQGLENFIEYLKENKEIADLLEKQIRELCIESNRSEGNADQP